MTVNEAEEFEERLMLFLEEFLNGEDDGTKQD